MNKQMKMLGTIFHWTAIGIKYYSTYKVAQTILLMPLVLMSIIHNGGVNQINAVESMKWYATYLSVAFISWYFYAIQKLVIEKTKKYKRMEETR